MGRTFDPPHTHRALFPQVVTALAGQQGAVRTSHPHSLTPPTSLCPFPSITLGPILSGLSRHIYSLLLKATPSSTSPPLPAPVCARGPQGSSGAKQGAGLPNFPLSMLQHCSTSLSQGSRGRRTRHPKRETWDGPEAGSLVQGVNPGLAGGELQPHPGRSTGLLC